MRALLPCVGSCCICSASKPVCCTAVPSLSCCLPAHPHRPPAPPHLPAPAVNSWGGNIGNLTWQASADSSGILKVLRDALAAVGNKHLFVTSAGNDYEKLEPQTNSSQYFFVPAQLRNDDGSRLDNMLVAGATGEWAPQPVLAFCLSTVGLCMYWGRMGLWAGPADAGLAASHTTPLLR